MLREIVQYSKYPSCRFFFFFGRGGGGGGGVGGRGLLLQNVFIEAPEMLYILKFGKQLHNDLLKRFTVDT